MVSKYLAVSAPERMAMTAGSSVFQGDRDASNPLAHVDSLLAARLRQTRTLGQPEDF